MMMTWHDMTFTISVIIFFLSVIIPEKRKWNLQKRQQRKPVVTKYVYEYEKYIVMVRKNKKINKPTFYFEWWKTQHTGTQNKLLKIWEKKQNFWLFWIFSTITLIRRIVCEFFLFIITIIIWTENTWNTKHKHTNTDTHTHTERRTNLLRMKWLIRNLDSK